MVGMPQIPGQEVLPFILLGAISGIGAPLFLKFLDLSKRQFQRTGLSLPARLGLGGLLLGLLLMAIPERSEEHTSELQSLMRISSAVFCLKKKKQTVRQLYPHHIT